MCVCVCVCVCVYLCIYMCVYILYVYICVYVRTYVYRAGFKNLKVIHNFSILTEKLQSIFKLISSDSKFVRAIALYCIKFL